MLRLPSPAAAGLLAALAVTALPIQAVTRLPSADGQYWDVQDTSPWAQDSGGIATGGASNPFNGFGYLKIRVSKTSGSVILGPSYLRGFGLSHDGGERFDSITPVLEGGVLVSRGIFAPHDTTYLRYFDRFTNTTSDPVTVDVAWGGAAGAFEDGGLMTVATTASGDRQIDAADTFVTVMQNVAATADPMRGPSGHGPSAHVLGNADRALFNGVGDMYADPFADRWPGYDPAYIAYKFRLTIPAGATRALMTFIVKGASESYDPRGGLGTPIQNGIVAPKYEARYRGSDARIPAAGSEIARVTGVARHLVAEPDVRGLTDRQLAQIANWRLAGGVRSASPFSVVEKTAPEIQTALEHGDVTSVDVVEEYLGRVSRFDRHGPALHSILALNHLAIADARRADAQRAAGRVRGPLHGIPVVYKDNIDVLGLPTTGGSLALVDHRPRLDSRVALGMREAGAVVLGKANLDEFPFGDFGISSVAGTIGNPFDPTLSTAGSSGGTAASVSASLVTLGFGTDTCNSLSNPASFASLATIRTTRGLTSRAGVMPLNTYNDAIGPIAKSVRELAQVLDAVTGSDAADGATADADSHRTPSFSNALDATALKGARIGVLRQLFVGITGEREAAAAMESAIAELRSAGATVLDVSIADLDDQYRNARGSAPGSLKAGWDAYLSRGARPDERVITLEQLLASGKLAPASARRFEDALKPSPTGAELTAATARFYSAREAFRSVFVALMDRERLDALLYPANQARPATHEGGLVRYGEEPGTCEESAMTGLPQVTVPAGQLGGRYPFGVSFLGRLWDDRRVLGLAFAYEQATHHRKPPVLDPTARR
jgi:amidase